jgi:hypothetical protein
MIGVELTLPLARTIHPAGNLSAYFLIERVVSGTLGLFVTSTWQVMTAVAYLELRRTKEGVALGDVAEIFA